ncbi:MAG TPA: 2Fe-2S iron-sulfur cluster-binding protein [Polyangia bacterium]|nr:2Fe-2S iron-sulfur cluster-binding protein [Polyangia bacterium]
MPFVTFQPSGVRVACADGDSVFNVGRGAGVDIATACVGKATCGLCRLKIVDGEAYLSPMNAAEKKHLGNVYFITKQRLACQTRVTGGDVVVEVPPK